MNSQQGNSGSIQAPKHGARVLLVEDDIAMELLWGGILRKIWADVRIDWVLNETEAEHLIEKAASHNKPYDLVITDIFLSGSKTGLDLWHKFKDTIGEQMIITSSIEDSRLFQYLQGGEMPVYLRKPLNPRECAEVVQQLVSNN